MTRSRELWDRDWAAAELDLALKDQECPACILGRQTANARLAWMARENIRQPETIERVVLARGLCGPHWEGVLNRVRRDAEAAAVAVVLRSAEALAEDLDRRVAPALPGCPICQSVAGRVRSTLEIVLERLAWEDTRESFRASFGLCQPHVVDALNLRLKPGSQNVLLEIHRVQLERLVARARGADEATASRMARLLALKLAGAEDAHPSAAGSLH